MKKLFKITLVLICLVGTKTYAQESIIGDIKYADLEKYIQLARENYTRVKIFNAKKESIKTQIPIAQMSYFDIFNASYFWRPKDKSVVDPINPYNVNGIQLSVNINLGNVLQKPFMVKRAKAEYKVAQLEAQEYNDAIAIEVKKRYYTYIQTSSELKIKTQTVQENNSVAESTRRKFEKGEVQLDAFNVSRKLQADGNSAKIQAEVNYLNAKDALEEIIGTKLSDVK